MEGIAAAAGVGKQTIYRWWSSKAAVVLEALLEVARDTILEPDTGSLRKDLEGFLSATFVAVSSDSGVGPILRALMAHAQLDPDFAKGFYQHFISIRRQVLMTLLQRAQNRGELPKGAPLELVTDILFGVLWYRLLIGHAPLDEALARELAELVVCGASRLD